MYLNKDELQVFAYTLSKKVERASQDFYYSNPASPKFLSASTIKASKVVRSQQFLDFLTLGDQELLLYRKAALEEVIDTLCHVTNKHSQLKLQEAHHFMLKKTIEENFKKLKRASKVFAGRTELEGAGFFKTSLSALTYYDEPFTPLSFDTETILKNATILTPQVKALCQKTTISEDQPLFNPPSQKAP